MRIQQRLCCILLIFIVFSLDVFAVDPINDSLTNWWSLNESTTIAIDLRGTVDGVPINVTLASDKNGRVNEAFQFNYSSDSIVNVSWYNWSYANFTWQAWVYLNDTPTQGSGNAYRIFNNLPVPGVGDIFAQLSAYIDSDTGSGNITWRMRETTGPFSQITTNFTLALNRWYHVMGTFNVENGQMILYVNGTKVGNTTYTGANWSASIKTLMVGNSRNSAGAIAPGNIMNGSIDDFSIWNSTLSAANISWLYNNGQGRTYENITSLGPVPDDLDIIAKRGNRTSVSIHIDTNGDETSTIGGKLNVSVNIITQSLEVLAGNGSATINFFNSFFMNASGNAGFGTKNPARQVHINDTLRIEPRSTAPTNPFLGDLYVDADTYTLCFYNSTNFIAAAGNGQCS